MPMYNLLEHIINYSMTSESLYNCYRYEINEVDHITLDDKSFDCETKY